MEISAPGYQIVYDRGTHTVFFKGALRLAGVPAYEPMKNVLNEAAKACPNMLTLNLKELEFLNSSGITTISMFLFGLKKAGTPKLTVLGSKAIAWQDKSLRNFKKIWNEVEVVID